VLKNTKNWNLTHFSLKKFEKIVIKILALKNLKNVLKSFSVKNNSDSLKGSVQKSVSKNIYAVFFLFIFRGCTIIVFEIKLVPKMTWLLEF